VAETVVGSSQVLIDDDEIFAAHEGGKLAVQLNEPLDTQRGGAVLGLGDIVAAASLPMMEGKSALFKTFGGLDSIPIVLDTKDPDEIVETLVRLRPTFGAANLEDMSAPRCFEIERRVIEALDGAEMFLGLSAGVVAEELIATMAPGGIVFALSNPDPEIHPDLARKYAAVVATGRSDFPNQINNVLAFPGVFPSALDPRVAPAVAAAVGAASQVG
jgi:malic enzyme